MSVDALQGLPKDERRRAMRLGNLQGALWAVGNGLTTGPFMIYLALELNATNQDIGLILAMPAFVGLLRLFAPRLFRALGGLKPGAVVCLTASYALLCLLPVISVAIQSSMVPARGWMVAFVAVLCVHQLLESIGLVAVWSWLGEIVPQRIRGRYFAARQRWQIWALVPTLLFAAMTADYVHDRYSLAMRTAVAAWAYIGPVAIGTVFLLASVVPLIYMRATSALEGPGSKSNPAGSRERSSLVGPDMTMAFARLVLVGCWLSFFNGLTQTAQNRYPRDVLKLDVLPLAIMRMVMQIGQIALAPVVGRAADRYGNRPVLVLCQAVVSVGLLFYWMATPEQPYWLAGAWIAWSAFVGLNVCLPNLMLKLSPRHDSSKYVATYFAITGLTYGAGTLFGSGLLDTLAVRFPYPVLGIPLNHYGYLFYIGWVTRALGAVLLLSLIEPGAWGILEVLRGRRKAQATTGVQPQSPWD